MRGRAVAIIAGLSTLVVAALLMLAAVASAEDAQPVKAISWQFDPRARVSLLSQANSQQSFPTVQEFAVVTNTYAQRAPAIDGSIVVWQDYRNGNWDIYAKNLNTGAETQITSNPYTQTAPAISGDIVVWEDFRNYSYCVSYGNCFGEIYGKNLVTGSEFLVASVSGYGGLRWPAISGNVAVWGRCISPAGIYGKDLATGRQFSVATSFDYCPGKVAIDGPVVVWEQYATSWDIHGKDLASGIVFDIAIGSA